MDPVAVMRAARAVRDELDHLLGGASGELRERLDPLLAEEGVQEPGPLADVIVMLIAQYGPAWERFTVLRRLNEQAAAEGPAVPPGPVSQDPPSAPAPAAPDPAGSASPAPAPYGQGGPDRPWPGEAAAGMPADPPAEHGTGPQHGSPPPAPPLPPPSPASSMPPAPTAPERGPSVLDRLTGAFRRRRRQPAPAGAEWEAFPLIEVADEVVAGWGVEVQVGLSPGGPPAAAAPAPGAGALPAPGAAPSPGTAPPPGTVAPGAVAPAGEVPGAAPFVHGPADLDIQLIAEGFEAPGGWRVRLRVDGASPYPRAAVRLVALPQEQPALARQIQAIHAVGGQVTGFGVRALAVLDSPGMLGRESVPQPVAGTRVRVAGGGEPADVTVVVVHGDRPGRLWWTYQSPHFTTPDQAEICELGMRTSEFGRHVAEQAHSVEDMGRRVASKIPRGFWELLHAVAGRVAPRRPSVLVLSQEPHIPWELATLEQPFDGSVPALLNCQTVTGRWPLGGRRPELPPPTRARGESMAVVYGGAEVHPLVAAYGAARVTPVLGDVLAMLAEPPDLIHFTAGGTASEALGRDMGEGPFVFLEEPGDCQAFLLAGASGVVAPLWPVGDGLAPEFYRRCLAGEPPAEVLRSLRCQVPATGPAYQFFGHPSLTLSRGHSRA
ncbi:MULTISPECIES: hypothetical protein [Streptosporangium]|uniref:CHAT domain-containing protein n=1 Tax=Streptosporangium brasiliense TaxID=47480 RepID=A0ABT9QZI8_9ACTN|nr:hypothetical protein [Streptosporangium brasiliense]MDP9862391.1 hypothetical protein [Streptosporangium brasiliense]